MSGGTERVVSTRFALDTSYRRPSSGATVVGGSPLRLFTLGAAGVKVLEAVERGGELPANHAPLTERLVDAGVLHPLPELEGPAHLPGDASDNIATQLTVVTPAYGNAPRFVATTLRTIVVDDASPQPLKVTGANVDVLRLDVNGGPGAARNAGLVQVTTPFVAFVDSDVLIDEQELSSLLAHFTDPRVALVAPRIVADPTQPGTLARFEQVHSPLDLGREPARIAPTTRVSYVPAAVVVCRVEALRSIGGFDARLRFGEDVDLVWRLVEADWRCRYEPRVEARHATRATGRDWALQRYRYGTSAAPLAARHRGALAPLRMSGWSAAVWGSVVAGAPLVGAVVGAATTGALVRKLRQLPARETMRLAGLGHLFAGRLVAGTMLRAWWPLSAAAAVVSRRARRVVLAAWVFHIVDGWRREHRADVPLAAPTYALLTTVDDLAYGAGVWAGAARERSADALLPRFEAWPPRQRGGTEPPI